MDSGAAKARLCRYLIAIVAGPPGTTTPNPTGGYFVMLRKSDCIELKMSVDEALKYVISMGVVVPGSPSNNNR